MVFQIIGLSWIIYSNKDLNFDFQNHFPSLRLNGPWYNTMIYSQLHCSSFEDYFTTAKRDNYNIMCSIESHGKIHKSVNYHKPVNIETSIGGARPLPSNSTEKH